MKVAGLDDRIADAFAGTEVPSADLEALLAEVTTAEQQSRDDYAAAKDVALDPATRPAAVADARKVMEDAEFTSTRLTNATQKLKDLLQEAQSRERAVAARQERAAALAERDELAKDLARFKILTDEMVGLLTRLSRSNRRLHGKPTSQGETAEALARGARSIEEAKSILLRTKLTSFNGSGSWPPVNQHNFIVLP